MVNGLKLFGAGLGLAATLALTTPSSVAGERVVLELFQSQGCSSCPPANANINALSGRNDVLALSFAVTYWDRLGWRDTFARDEFTTRQYDYARGLHIGNVYTPQVVVNGRQDLTGISRSELDGAVARAPRVPTHPLALQGDMLTVQQGSAGRTADIWFVAYDPRVIQVAIQAGENDGRTLPHKNIVKTLSRLGVWSGQEIHLRLPRLPDPNLRVAILLQAPNGGPILAALAP